MVVKLRSESFLFKEGQALVSPVDSGTIDLHMLDVQNGEIQDLGIEKPGSYRLQLFDLQVERTDDHKSVRVPLFICQHFLEFTTEDVKRGYATSDVQIRGGLFRLTLVDEERKPLPHHELRMGPGPFGVDLTENMFFATIKTDDTGSLVCLGPLFQLDISLDRNNGLLIFPI